MPRVILSHLDLLHAVGREPARAAFHGPLPETALPNAEHWRDRSQTAVRALQDTQGSPHPPPQARGLPTAPLPTPSRPFSSFILLAFPWEDSGIHTADRNEQMDTAPERHVEDRDTHRRTHSRGTSGRGRATSSSQLAPLFPPLEATPSLLCRPPQGSLPKAQGHCAVAKRLGHTTAQRRVDLTAVSFSGSHGRRAPMRIGPPK